MIKDVYFAVFSIILLYFFPLFLVVSVAGCIFGTYMAPPTDENVLKEFYRTVRPWGFWEPIHNKVMAEYPDFKKNTNFKRDMFNIFVGIIAQTCLVAFPIFIILRKFDYLSVTIAIIIVSGLILKKTWWDKLDD